MTVPCSGASVRLDWIDNSADEEAFVVRRAVDGGTPEPVATLPADTTTWTDESVQAGASYSYSVVSRNSAGDSLPTVSVSARVEAPQPGAANLSTRSLSGPGERVAIGGFVLQSRQTVLLRGVGPGLRSLGVAQAAQMTRIALFRGSELLEIVEGWTPDLVLAFEEVGAFPLVDGDTAFLIVLEPGIYTFHVEAVGAEGIVLSEIYLL